jgi:hypothetical protein
MTWRNKRPRLRTPGFQDMRRRIREQQARGGFVTLFLESILFSSPAWFSAPRTTFGELPDDLA